MIVCANMCIIQCFNGNVVACVEVAGSSLLHVCILFQWLGAYSDRCMCGCAAREAKGNTPVPKQKLRSSASTPNAKDTVVQWTCAAQSAIPTNQTFLWARAALLTQRYTDCMDQPFFAVGLTNIAAPPYFCQLP